MKQGIVSKKVAGKVVQCIHTHTDEQDTYTHKMDTLAVRFVYKLDLGEEMKAKLLFNGTVKIG